MSREFEATRFMVAPDSFVGEVWGHVMRAGQAFMSLAPLTPGEAEQLTPPLPVWATPVARVFLHGSHQQPQV